MNKYISECIGTFALVFAGTAAIIINAETGGTIGHAGIATTFGLVVMAMIYTFGGISGAHFNPAVTIAFTVAKRLPVKETAPYIIAQLSGAFIASGILKMLFPNSITLGATIPAGSYMQSFILEVILTFILMLVILNVSTGEKEKGITAGLAIGATVWLGAMFAGPICGASMNPARSIAPAVVSMNISVLWIYIIAPIAGALFSIIAHKLVFKQA